MNRRTFLAGGFAWGCALLMGRAWSQSRTPPGELRPAVDVCPFCSMPVVDARFAARGVTPGGVTHTYDAIECLLDHLAGRAGDAPEIAQAWLADRNASTGTDVTWLAAEDAWLLVHPRLRTPMGGGVAAFASAADATAFQEAQRLTGAELLRWDEALAFGADRAWVPLL